MQSEKQKIVWQLGLLIVAAFYLFVRLRCLADSCLVFDEIFSVHAATHSWDSLLPFVAADLIHPPLFYVLLKLWILAGGESLVWLRLFPVFFAVLAVLPFLLLCRELKLKSVEILTAFVLIAINGALIRYSQEVRMYSLLFSLSLFSVWLFLKLINYQAAKKENFDQQTKFPTKTLCALFAVNLLLIYTHYFGWLVILAEIVAFEASFRFTKMQIKSPRVSKGVVNDSPLLTRGLLIKSVGLLALCFAPWAVWIISSAMQQTGGLAQNLGWAAKPGLAKILQIVLILNEPFYYQQSSIDPINIWIIAAPIALLSLGVIAASCLQKPDRNLALLAIFAVVPFLTAFLASWILPYSIWGVRHLIIIFAPASIVFSITLWRISVQWLKYAALGLFAVLIVSGALLHFTKETQTFIWCGWRELAAQIKTETPETVYIFEDDGAYQLWYWLKNDSNFKIVSIDGYADMPEDKAYFLPRRFDEIETGDKTIIAGDKFWLAFRETTWKPDKQVLRDLIAQGYKVGRPLEFHAQGVTAFMVKIEKAN